MSNQHTGDLRAAILAAVKGPEGMQTSQIKGFTVLQVGRMVQKLQAANLVFRAPLPGKHGRYFDCLSRAETWANSMRAQPVPAVRVKVATWGADVPMNIPEGLEKQVHNAPAPRYSPDANDPSWRLFSACRLGEYISPASSCAARAV